MQLAGSRQRQSGYAMATHLGGGERRTDTEHDVEINRVPKEKTLRGHCEIGDVPSAREQCRVKRAANHDN